MWQFPNSSGGRAAVDEGDVPNCTLFSFQYILFILHFTCNLWQADYHINKLGRQFYFLLWCRANVAPQIRGVAAEKGVRSRKAAVFLWHGIRTHGQKTEILPHVKDPLSSFQYWPRTDIWEGIQELSRYMNIQCQVILQSCYTLQYRSFPKQVLSLHLVPIDRFFLHYFV